jgi:hypothetical protein
MAKQMMSLAALLNPLEKMQKKWMKYKQLSITA